MTDSAAENDVWTVQRILQWTTKFLREKGVESARLEAELLLAHARGCQRIHLYADLNAPLDDAERGRMREFVKRRSSREPLSYITGKREFYGRDFQVGAGVLIPRPETESLIDVCLEFIPADTESDVCEVGFGSGCVCTTLALQREKASLYATDVSEIALSFATKNVAAYKLEDRVTLFSGDGFEPLQGHGPGRFHGLVSNPPYICQHEMAELEPEVADHEPREALVSGEDGLDLIRRLIQTAPDILHCNAWVALELDPSQASRVSGLFTQRGFTGARVHQDLNGQDRIVSAHWPGD